jgi:amino acid adenylation domain-containing protein
MRTDADLKRELLATLLRERATETSACPLSYGQKALWFLYQADPQSPAYNTALAARITGPVDTAAMQAAFQGLIARHAALRTTFSTKGGETFQHVRGPHHVQFSQQNMSSASDDVLSRALIESYRQPFDLRDGPVMRATLFSRSSVDHVLLVAVHHIVCDAWSLWIMADELGSRLSHGRQPDAALAPTVRSYADFVNGQQAMLNGPRGEELLQYWRAQLESHVPLTLPTDHPRPSIRSLDGDSCFFELSSDLIDSLRTFATANGTTLYTVLLAAFEVLLYRYSHQPDFTLGTLTSGRTNPEFAGVVGYFANPVVIRARVDGNAAFATFLAQVRESVLGALAHQDCPFPFLVERLGPTHDPSRIPFMDALFVYQKRQSATLTGGGDMPRAGADHDAQLRFAPFEIPQMEGQFDLTLEITDSGRSILKYSRSLFDRSRILRMASHFECLLRCVVANPTTRVSMLSLLPPDERTRLLATWNATATDLATNHLLHEGFERQTARTPENVAVRYQARQLTYRALNQYANALATELQGRGTRPETIVGVCLERSLELPIALLAVLKAGGAYLPLDPSYPRQRLEYMARTAGVRVVLSTPELRSRLSLDVPGSDWFDVDLNALAHRHAPNPVSGSTPESLAYVIYTSGSTGDPKGAMNTHRAICNRLTWMQNTYRLRPADRVLQKTPFSFDVSVWELFWPLLNGAAIVVADPGGHQDAAYLVRTVRTERITVVHFVPSMLRPFLEEPDVTACDSLRQIFCSGEALTTDLEERCHARLAAELHNLYGPTEAAIDVTFWHCERGRQRATVPIGRPIANTQIYVLDGRMQPVPIGIAGELLIGGANLGRGYVNRPDLTAERFVPNPYGEAGTRLYRTGDVGRFLEDGAIEYLGRADHQVKLRGVRVELAEVESALLKHPNIGAVAARVWNENGSDARLVAYVAARADPAPSTSELRQFLADKLPPNMIPELFEQQGALPLTSSGKIDRKRLPAPRSVRPNLDTMFEGPRTELEAAIASVWRNVLRVERVGIHDNFFDLGGHSLRMTQVIGFLEEQVGRRPSLVELFQHPTICSLAAHLSGGGPASGAGDVPSPDRVTQARRLDELRTIRQRHRASREAQDIDHG